MIASFKNDNINETFVSVGDTVLWAPELSKKVFSGQNMSTKVRAFDRLTLTKDMFNYGSLQGDGTGRPIYYDNVGYSQFIRVKGGSTLYFHREGQVIDGEDANLVMRIQARVSDNFTDGKGWKLILLAYSWVDSIVVPNSYKYVTIGIRYDGNNRDFKKYYDGQLSISSDYPLEIMRNIPEEIGKVSIGTSDIVGLNSPHEYLPMLANLGLNYHVGGVAAFTPKPLTMLHFSDVHGDIENMRRIAQFYKHYSTYINDVIHTGDGVYNIYTDNVDFWDESEANWWLNVLGNHDANDNGTLVSSADCYARYFSQNIGNWNVVQPEGADKCYYYKDYASNKIRLIVLDCMHYDTAQDQWFSEILNDILTNYSDYSVIVSNHYSMSISTPTEERQATAVKCSFTSLGRQAGSGSSMPQLIIDAVDSYMERGGKFVCHLTGHVHSSMISYSNSPRKQLCICVGSATARQPQWEDGQRIRGTKSQDHFNVVGFDTYNQHIRIVKVGKTYNQYMQQAKSIAIKYDQTGIENPVVYSEN